MKAEIEDQFLRVRNHPSIAIWSGNNEIRSFVGYPELFDQVIGGALRELAPGQPYQNTSGGTGAPDAHDWGLGTGASLSPIMPEPMGSSLSSFLAPGICIDEQIESLRSFDNADA